MKRYAEYDFTNLKWFPLKPTHWELRPAKSVFALRNEKEREGDVHLTPSQTYGVLPQAEYMRVTGSRVVLALAGTTMKHVEPDDFVIHLRSFQGGIELSRFRGKVSPAYTVLIPEGEAFPGYFRYVLKAPGYVQTIASLTDQLRDGQTMRYSDFGKVPLVVPPLEEQRAIADFLDRETAEIDAFIADQERLIELLTERRTATITHAVTKGLDPSAPMRDSGIPWLGHIPAHWVVARFGWLCRISNGADYKAVEVEESGGAYPVYGSGGVFRWASDYLFEGKSLLLGRKGTIDRPLLVDGRFWTVDTMFYTERFDSRTMPEFLWRCAQTWPYARWATSTALPSMTQNDLKSIEVALPPRQEQMKIIDFLDTRCREIDSLMTDAKRAIELSKERRAALISAAVTGQIDVRTHA